MAYSMDRVMNRQQINLYVLGFIGGGVAGLMGILPFLTACVFVLVFSLFVVEKSEND